MAKRKKTSTKKTASPSRYAIGVDYGTNSVRALIVDLADGSEIGQSVYNYPSGEAGVIVAWNDPNLARQSPRDYVAGLEASIRGALKEAARHPGFSPELVVGIGVDTTGSTPLPVDRNNVPLAMHDEFADDPAAQAWLWKDHTGHAEAAEITEKAARSRTKYLAKCGGTYSSEWYWSKLLRCRRVAPKVFKASYSWVELADYIPGVLIGCDDPDLLPRGICAAGHKAMYHESWGGLPRPKFLESLHPDLVPISKHYRKPAMTADKKAGNLCPEWAAKLGLPETVAVAVGAFDAHMGAVGAGIKPGTLVKIIGTSTCDMMVARMNVELPDIPGLCGIVPGSVLPDMYGLEAGQSAVGDIFNWFASNLTPKQYAADPHAMLTEEAAKLRPGENGLVALDWNNGNRTILVDPLLTGLLVGQTLHTTAPEIYRALIESTAYGALTIIKRFEEYGVKVREVVNCGGIAEKNPLVMQIYADITGRPMKISRSAQTCALGAAIFGAVAGGGYRSVATAQRAMTGVKEIVYRPDRAAHKVYTELYKIYRTLHDAMGTPGKASLTSIMKDLITIRHKARHE